MKSEGRVWKFGDNVDTDVIIPARFLNVSDRELLAKNCFVDVRPDFSKTVRPGDVLVAGNNFGCGSSREHAPLAIRAAGISVVIARSFARIFYRNAFNIGLPILESEEAVQRFEEGSRIQVDLESGEIRGEADGVRIMAKPIPPFMRDIVQSGGLVAFIQKKGFF